MFGGMSIELVLTAIGGLVTGIWIRTRDQPGRSRLL